MGGGDRIPPPDCFAEHQEGSTSIHATSESERGKNQQADVRGKGATTGPAGKEGRQKKLAFATKGSQRNKYNNGERPGAATSGEPIQKNDKPHQNGKHLDRWGGTKNSAQSPCQGYKKYQKRKKGKQILEDRKS